MKDRVNYPAVLHFISKRFDRDAKEYVVIATDGPVQEHCVHGFKFHGAVELDDEGTLPLNEPLWRH